MRTLQTDKNKTYGRQEQILPHPTELYAQRTERESFLNYYGIVLKALFLPLVYI